MLLGPAGGHWSEAMRIDCDECVMQHTEACEDCVVTFVINRRPGEPVDVHEGEVQAFRVLGAAGLVPRLRLVSRARAS
jgi:hypothetical protein